MKIKKNSIWLLLFFATGAIAPVFSKGVISITDIRAKEKEQRSKNENQKKEKTKNNVERENRSKENVRKRNSDKQQGRVKRQRKIAGRPKKKSAAKIAINNIWRMIHVSKGKN
ncbi:MAG: hypothetical protein ABUK01_19015 [Leptospirales bacterium]